MDMSREHRIEVALGSLGQQSVQRCAAHPMQIRSVAADALLPFAALYCDAVGGGLDGLDALLARPPDAQRYAVALEQMVGRVEIGGHKMPVFGELSVARPKAARGGKLLQVCRGDFKLEFGF